MKKTVTFSTSKGNVYLYSPFRNQILLCHPVIPILYNEDSEGTNLEEFLKSHTTTGKSVTIINSVRYPSNEARAQLARYRFLKKHNYFRNADSLNLEGKLTALKINENLSKIKQVIFETTEDCNLDCVYCTFSKFYINKERGKREFNFDHARRMLALILSKRTTATELIISFYGGEPLKNFKFIRQIVEFCNSSAYQHLRFKYTMSSNGLLLAKHAGFLAEHKMEVSISLDGDSQGNSFRVLKNNSSSYDLVVKNIDTVKAKYPDYFDKNISFLTVLHNQNSLGSVYSYFKERYNKVPLISSISTLNINEEFKDEFHSTFLEKRRTDSSDSVVMQAMSLNHPGVKEIADVVEKYSGFVFKNYYHVISSKSNGKANKQFVPTATCMPFSMRVFLTADGSILPCEHISRVFEIGKFDDNNIIITPEEIADMYNGFFDKIKTLCRNCLIADHCKECVFNTRVDTDYPECEFFTDEKKFSRELSRTFGLIEQDYPFFQRIVKEAFHEK